jgi:hypothetical protein
MTSRADAPDVDVHVMCTDRGQHSPRELAVMVRRPLMPLGLPDNVTARWHVVVRDSWLRARAGRHVPVVPVGGYSHNLLQELIEADGLEFRCPTCRRRPRWRRDKLDELCERVCADYFATPVTERPPSASVDLSRLE